ncbi:MAG: BamA/TamA family outer membrane protein [Limimaricola sp.]|uniref:ShlB/FhaC/HecB family hemolysin secretion/activation protein n=1 Tax=Limimaricola sp. TaxID=2211665 RepID=UPI001D789C2F|nr:POTRA domain-containing protein [Limimaricola sp.]MBI1415968.1 BamA/TamA family outer membrane protein [Limimaricola sp.]
MAQKSSRGALGMRPLRFAGYVGAIGVLAATAAFADTPVNPATTAEQQALLRAQQLQAESASRISGPVVISPERARGDRVPPGGPTVLLKAVDITPPSAFISQAELDAITAKYIGHNVDFSQIQQLVQDINDLYEKKGVVTASAVLPPQTLNAGVLKINLVEGRLGSVAVSGGDKVPDNFVLDRIHLTTAGNVVDVPTAARDIARFNAVYDVQLRMSLQPGEQFGTTDIAFQLTEPRTNQLSFFFDNMGIPSTGQGEGGVYYHRYGLWTTDDNLIAYATLAAGSAAGTLSYDTPITPVGTRLALSYSRSVVRTISGPTASLDIRGRSQSVSATLSQPLYFDKGWTIIGSGALSYGTSNSTSGATPLVDAETTRTSLGLSISHTGAKFSFNVAPQIVRAFTKDNLEPSSRNITLFTGSFNGSYRLNDAITLTGAGAWQYTDAKLIPGDLLFQVGGSGTVRGYPSGAQAGDSGFFGQFEAHKSLDNVRQGLDVFGFVDLGAVYSTFPSKVFFVSAGAGISYQLPNNAKLELGIGVPLKQSVDNQKGAEIYARVTVNAF